MPFRQEDDNISVVFSAIFHVVTEVKRFGTISCFRHKVGILFVYAIPAGFVLYSQGW